MHAEYYTEVVHMIYFKIQSVTHNIKSIASNNKFFKI